MLSEDTYSLWRPSTRTARSAVAKAGPAGCASVRRQSVPGANRKACAGSLRSAVTAGRSVCMRWMMTRAPMREGGGRQR